MMLSFLALCLGVVSCYDDTALLERIEALETTKIATINQQIDAIKGSIIDLEATDKELDAAIAALIKENAERDERLQADVDSLKAKDTALEARIEELKAYVEAELASTKDWANTTFTTLEQYQATCDELAAIKVLIAEQEASIKQALVDAIATSESSIKGWVNEQLTGYWTIAETQAKLDTIKTNTDKEVAAIKADLKAAKEELTAAYKSEIAKAITDSEGKLSAKIDEINSALDKRIGAIEVRLDAIEEKLNNLTREFAIEFDDTEIGIMPGGTSSVSYTITGATETTIVKALGQNGWNAKVSMESNTTGSITVTAPAPITEDEIIVLVYDGEYRTIMSTLNFVKGFATPSQAAAEFDAEADTVSIELTSNLDYEVSIPTEAQSWLSVVEPSATRAVTTKTISFACTECIGGIRKATVSFVDQAGVAISTMSFIQQGSAVEVTLTEAGTLLEAMGQDVYKEIKGLIIHGPINGTDVLAIRRMKNLTYLNMENAHIVAGGDAYYIYTDIFGGITEFFTENDIVGEHMFDNAPCFQEGSCEVILPKGVTSIENHAFFECSSLTAITLPEGVTSIENHAFFECSSLTAINIPEGVTSIGERAFYDCRSLTAINIPEGVTSIGGGAFTSCSSLTAINIPEGVTSIGEYAFRDCSSLTAINIPEGVTSIGSRAFSECRSLKSIKVLATTPPTAAYAAFDGVTGATLYVPEEAVSTYQNTAPWSDFSTIIGF